MQTKLLIKYIRTLGIILIVSFSIVILLFFTFQPWFRSEQSLSTMLAQSIRDDAKEWKCGFDTLYAVRNRDSIVHVYFASSYIASNEKCGIEIVVDPLMIVTKCRLRYNGGLIELEPNVWDAVKDVLLVRIKDEEAAMKQAVKDSAYAKFYKCLSK